ncbi:DddA-like double-stranded DNA deaminase toxin [Actinoplanes sp. HUAS TT8]|uniref:DddA-like double-stranded DNA deaminase toxin n=1 Tax=Actinoplanes sp. HUAS TT8 TaxID=3447453 RepID=UPI003F51C907
MSQCDGFASRKSLGDADHVETKVVHMMHERGIEHAEVVINNVNGPCVTAPPGLACSNTLAPLLVA